MAAEHELSEPARARMAAMLPELLVVVRARRRRRVARRGALLLALLVAPLLVWPGRGERVHLDARDARGAGGTVAAAPVPAPPRTPDRDAPGPERVNPATATATSTAAAATPATRRWREVRDDPTVLARCAIAARAPVARQLDDDALRAELRAADRPDGLVRAGDRVLVSAAAIDPWPGEAP